MKFIAFLIPLSLGAAPLLAAGMMTPGELKQRISAGDKLLLLDIRSRNLSTAETIPGAMHGGSDPAGFLPDSRGGEVVLIYGSGTSPQELDAWERRLRQANFRVFVLQGGIDGWKASNGALVNNSGSFHKPGSLPFVVPRGLCEPNEPAQVFQ